MTTPTTKPTIPTSVKTYLTLQALSSQNELRFLPLCIPCQSAVLPKSLLEHFRKVHNLPAEARGDVRRFIAALPEETRALDFSDVEYALDCVRLNVPGLKVVDAWVCKVAIGGMDGRDGGERVKECGFIRKDVTDVRRHVNSVHGVGARGMYGACKAQSWFSGRRAAYWRLSEDDLDGRAGSVDGMMSDDVVEREAQNREVERESRSGNSISKGSDQFMNGVEEEKEGDGTEKRLETPIFTSICRWGFYGKGFGDKTPRSWREGEERELGVGTMF
ncbi:hypothetical protein VTL71DRAFT_4365 [Oculimacula yallundae]|uniref:Uncharacterized protein n=1 Tax=Oculimacula yallundae TaxID=86028 RepID=A0ABR4C3C0_9HELO